MNVHLDEDDAAALRLAAARAGISVQHAARLAVREWLRRADGMTMADLMARPPLGGGHVPPGTAARVLHEVRLRSGRE